MTDNPFKKPSELGGGGVFKPAEAMNDLALLIEPKSIARQVPHEYQGTSRPRDEVIADVTVFATQEALDKAEPSKVQKDVKVVHGMLTSSLERIIGSPMVAIVRKVPTQKGSGFVFRDPEPEAEAAVVAYYTSREALAADAPDFD